MTDTPVYQFVIVIIVFVRSWHNAGLGRESLLSSEAEELPRKTVFSLFSDVILVASRLRRARV